tara:strand:- start:1595 stop:2572 length:978 start_codon:yes stop_codon:yes gene_type:complete
MKNILITGADGFIGSHLVELLLKKNYNVTALCHYNSHNELGWLKYSAKNKPRKLKIITGDINDDIFCDNILKSQDVLVNLAALISIPHSYTNPRIYFKTNVDGSMNLAKSSLKNKLKKIIHISTSEVYGTAIYVPIDEKHDLQPQSPYSASKISAETVMRSFHYSYGLPVVILRLFNTFGPRQSIRAVIPKIISQLLSDKKEIYLGNLKPTRDFNYVLDTCSAIELASKKLKVGQIYNYGSGEEINIKDLFKLISKVIGVNAKLTTKKNLLRPKKSEVFRLLCDNKKFISATNFKPKFNLKKGLIKTIEWYKDNLDEYKNSEFFE